MRNQPAIPYDADDYSHDHEILHMETLNVGTRQYPDGEHVFLTVGNADDEERVTLWTRDRAGLLRALRRAVAVLEGSIPSRFNLPAVYETLEEFAARTGG